MGDLARIVVALIILYSILPCTWRGTMQSLIDQCVTLLVVGFLLQAIWSLVVPGKRK